MLQVIKREGLYGSGGEYLPLFHMQKRALNCAGMQADGVSAERIHTMAEFRI